MPGSSWDCLTVVGGWCAATGVQWVEARSTAQDPPGCKGSPHNQELCSPQSQEWKSAPKVEIEKPWVRGASLSPARPSLSLPADVLESDCGIFSVGLVFAGFWDTEAFCREGHNSQREGTEGDPQWAGEVCCWKRYLFPRHWFHFRLSRALCLEPWPFPRFQQLLSSLSIFACYKCALKQLGWWRVYPSRCQSF